VTQVIEKVLEVVAAEAETAKKEGVAWAMVAMVAMVTFSVGAARAAWVVAARAVQAAV